MSPNNKYLNRRGYSNQSTAGKTHIAATFACVEAEATVSATFMRAWSAVAASAHLMRGPRKSGPGLNGSATIAMSAPAAAAAAAAAAPGGATALSLAMGLRRCICGWEPSKSVAGQSCQSITSWTSRHHSRANCSSSEVYQWREQHVNTLQQIHMQLPSRQKPLPCCTARDCCHSGAAALTAKCVLLICISSASSSLHHSRRI